VGHQGKDGSRWGPISDRRMVRAVLHQPIGPPENEPEGPVKNPDADTVAKPCRAIAHSLAQSVAFISPDAKETST